MKKLTSHFQNLFTFHFDTIHLNINQIKKCLIAYMLTSISCSKKKNSIIFELGLEQLGVCWATLILNRFPLRQNSLTITHKSSKNCQF